MKKITFFISVLACSFGFAQTNPIDFETGGNGATWTWNVFENDTNPALEFVANPSTTGNTTATVAKFTALQTGNPWAGCESAHGSPLGTFDLTASNAIIKIWVYKPVISDVGIKLVTPSGGAQPEKKVANTLVNQWEELTFDFTNYIGLGETTGLDQVVVFPDFNLAGRTQTNVCYFDQITFSSGTPAPTGPLLPLTFESSTLTYTFTDFGKTVTTKIANPDASGMNTSATVAQSVKGATGVPSETWAGSFIELAAPIDFSTSQVIKIKTWSPQAGITVRLKLENSANGAVFVEQDATTTVANAWEELTFTFAGIVSANNYQKVVVFFDFGNAQSGTTYYFDDVQLDAGTPPVMVELPLDFESSTLTYTFTDFGGAVTTKIANPDASGINTSATVAQSVKGAMGVPSETWAGSFIELGAPIDFSSTDMMKIKTWSPQAGITVRLKLENSANGAVFVEQDATTTVANAWEELTFTFAGIVSANNYQKVVVFFDFGNAQSGTTYYFDDVMLATTASASSFNAASVSMYPNPSNNFITIDAKDTIETITVSNILGQTVMQKEVNEISTSLDIASLNAGQYFVSIFSNNNRVVKKLIKK